MPEEGFLQRFHDLAEANEEFRCSSALAVRQALAKNGAGTELNGSASEEDLQYALRRLVRGVQSSRQCCRQGFSLALAELLVEFPDELAAVLQLIRQHTGLQTGLRSGELKERLLARLFAYASVVEAGCLHGSASVPKARKKQGAASPVGELGAGLYEVFAARTYLRAPATHLLVQICSELCGAGHASSVPAVVESWALDAKLEDKALSEEGKLDAYVVGVVLELRLAYLAAAESGVDKGVLNSWPACVRNDVLARPAAISVLTAAVATELVGLPVSDAVPLTVSTFCRWLFRLAAKGDPKDIQSRVWPALDKALFPENAAASTQAQGLRGLGEIAMRLQEAGSANAGPHAEALLLGFFESMQRGLGLLFQMLSWQRAHTHHAAVFANSRLAEAVGAVPQAMQVTSKNKRKSKGSATLTPSTWSLDDNTRIAILACLQRYRGFGSMKGTYQRQWQQALVVPLSTKGIRARCSSLFVTLASAAATARKATKAEDEADDDKGENMTAKPADARVYAEQLVQVAAHPQAPDEVILALMCTLFTASYFKCTGDISASVGYSLKVFREAKGLGISSGKDDLLIPVFAGTDGEEVKHWRAKFWSGLTALVRRTTRETAQKHIQTEEGDETGNAILKTLAFQGCLSDGSLWLVRLHEWMDHVLEHSPSAPSASPKTSPKKKKRTEGVGLKLAVKLGEEDLALRSRCLHLCRTILAAPQEEGCIPPRQLNAICGLPLSLAFAMIQAEDEEEREGVREALKELTDALEKVSGLLEPGQKKKALKQRNEALAVLPRIACEVFVESNGVVKEATKAAFRELGEFISDETVTSLCASVCDADGPGDEPSDEEDEEPKAKKGGKKNNVEDEDEDDDEDADEDEEDENDDEDEEEEGDDVGGAAAERKAARIAQFQEATERLRKAREAGEDGDDDGDEVMLGSDEILDQLLDDSGGDGSLLAAFANSGLEGDDAAGPKMTKRQKRLRQRQEDLARKFRELELLELFMQRFVDKRPVAVTVLQRLFEAMIAAARRAAGGKGGATGDAGDGKAGAQKPPKADQQIRRVEADLARRLGEVLAKAVKQVKSWAVVREVCQWHSKEEWASHARSVFAMGQGSHVAGVGQRPSEVGAVFFYWLCCLHRAKSVGADADPSLGNEVKAKEGWNLAEELLSTALTDWSGKKDSERWSSAIFGAFASRAPAVLLKMPWLEQLRESRNTFVQRTQINLIANHVLRNLPPGTKSTVAFVAKFVEVCAEMLEGTLAASDKEESNANAPSTSQRQKIRRDVLRALASVLRAHGKKKQHGEKASVPLDATMCKKVVEVLRTVVAALPARRGEVYQLCLHLQRSLRSGQDGKLADAPQEQETGKDPAKKGKKRALASNGGAGDSGEGATPRPEDEDAAEEPKARTGGAKENKKRRGSGKGFFGDM